MAKKKKARSGYFIIDGSQIDRIAKNYGLEEMAAYVSLAVSTDESNTSTVGGINSIMKYSGLTRGETKKAIETLHKAGIVEVLDVERKRARSAKRYSLPVHDNRSHMTTLEHKAAQNAVNGKPAKDNQETQALYRAKNKGWVEKLSTGWEPISHNPNRVFVPNNFARVNGKSMLHRIVSTGEASALALMMHIYQRTDMENERGYPIEYLGAYYQPNRTRTYGATQLVELIAGREWGEKSFDLACHRNHAALEHESFWDDL